MTARPHGNQRAADLLPAGLVTFAFTDIEGSTGRWERDRVAMQDAVRRHDAILHAAITGGGGQVFKTMGDAFCVAFVAPQDAIAAMLAAQRALSTEDFSAVDGLRVRVAINAGSAELRDGDYFGPALNKVARLIAIGYGGQILLTSETAALVDGTLPEDLSLRDLGAYRLKDFAEPQRVYQVIAPGCAEQFPPLRSLGTLPSNLSIVDVAEFRPVASFSGRDEELATVRSALERDGAIAVLHGLGGIGKSSIAREYGWRSRDEYSVVWWLSAESEDGVIDGLLRLGKMFVEGLERLEDRRAAAQRVVNSLLGGFDKPVLLVFDNLEDDALMRTWLPHSARALATSRNSAWPDDIVTISLHTWSIDAAIDYLRRASGRTDLTEEQAREIAESLGVLPLALAHAGAALRSMRVMSPQRYLEYINEHLNKAPRGAEYPRSVFATFRTAIEQAEQQAAGAAAILCLAASFAPDAIPDELFRQTADHYADGLRPTLSEGIALDLRSATAGELQLDEALSALDRLSLLRFAQSSQTYGVHRLVQLAAHDLAGENAAAWRICAVSVVDGAFPEKIDVPTWPQCERLLPHARTVLDVLPDDCTFTPAARLATQCADYLWQRGEYTAAEQISKRGLAICENALGPDHPDVARSLHVLGMVYWIQGRHAEAEVVFSRALAIREKTLGPDHPDVARSLNSLGLAYPDQAEAEPFYARATAIWERTLGPEHPDVALGLVNLAVSYFKQTRYSEAESLCVRALAIREKAHGPDHPYVAYCLTNLAMLYQELGRYAEAEPLNLRSIAIRERALGPDHPYVAMSLTVLALMYTAQGRYADAEELHVRALAIREKAFGPERLDVAQSLNNLGNLYRLQQRYAEAEPLLARALSLREKARGPDHVEVAESLRDLANVYRGQGRYAEAEPLFTRALAIYQKRLGPDNPDTKATRDALAALHGPV
jgi:class 3 adenylate cyclase/tetratricopeptide (TPR) repeat protein